MNAFEAPGTRVTFSPDSKLVAAGSFDSELIIGELATGNVIRRWRSPPGTCTLEFNQGGTTLMSAHLNGLICFWEVATGKLLQRWRSDERIEKVRFSSNQKYLFVASTSSTLSCVECRVESNLP